MDRVNQDRGGASAKGGRTFGGAESGRGGRCGNQLAGLGAQRSPATEAKLVARARLVLARALFGFREGSVLALIYTAPVEGGSARTELRHGGRMRFRHRRRWSKTELHGRPKRALSFTTALRTYFPPAGQFAGAGYGHPPNYTEGETPADWPSTARRDTAAGWGYVGIESPGPPRRCRSPRMWAQVSSG